MKMDDYTAIFDKFTILCRHLAAKAKTEAEKQKKKKAVGEAWLAVAIQFMKIEMPDRLEVMNFQSCMLHPLAERKLKVFEGWFVRWTVTSKWYLEVYHEIKPRMCDFHRFRIVRWV
jgi:hypothetical protein